MDLNRFFKFSFYFEFLKFHSKLEVNNNPKFLSQIKIFEFSPKDILIKTFRFKNFRIQIKFRKTLRTGIHINFTQHFF